MDRPYFPPAVKPYPWTTRRVDWVRHLAVVESKTAAEVAIDTGLPVSTITGLAQREHIRFANKGRKGKRAFVIDVPPAPMAVIHSLARLGGKDPRATASLLLLAVTEQGETFSKNLLDLEG